MSYSIYEGNKIKEDVEETCKTRGEEKKCVQNFSW
jgi:hypothetical protein